MLLMRIYEEKAGHVYVQQTILGFCHRSSDEDADMARTIPATSPAATVITSYRDHAHALAKGMSANECMAELFGKVTGCSKGKGGSMHFFSKEHGMMGGHGIVGGQIPLGAGIAFAEQYLGTDNVNV